MKKNVRKTLKIFGIILMTIVILLLTVAILVNTDYVQNKLKDRAVEMLKKDLQTDIRVGHVSVNILRQSINLEDVEIDDRQGRKMLRTKEISAGLQLKALLRKDIIVTDVDISGVRANLCRPASPTDSAANFQFLIDTFKKKKTPGKDKGKKGSGLNFQIKTASVGIDSLCYATDNGKPRKNTGKPHRGAFDVGHLDIFASMQIKMENIGKEGFEASLSDCKLTDKGSGLKVESITLKTTLLKDTLSLSDVSIKLPHGNLAIAQGSITLPDKKTGRKLSYATDKLTGTVQLRDISKPFAPALKGFKIPLNLQCRVKGDTASIHFDNVSVSTTDKKLHVNAAGWVTPIKGKHKQHVHFNVAKMTTDCATAERIINQFTVKKFMMKQLLKLGKLSFRGSLDVKWKNVAVAGRLNTAAGGINTRVTVDSKNKYLLGSVDTDSLQLGKVMEMPEIGPVSCNADFRFDISKQRTAQMRRQKGGKLPIGSVKAMVRTVSYKFIKMHNLDTTIESDGAEANGKILNVGKVFDVSCSFSFTDTNEMHKLKVKPGLRLNFFDKEKREERKAKREARKAERKALKEERKAERERKKAEKKQEKALSKKEKAL